MFRKAICGILSAILITGLVGLSVSANSDSSSFEFEINGEEHTVTVEGIPEEFREAIAMQLLGIDDDSVQIYAIGIACKLFGHVEDVGISTHTAHKERAYEPRCTVYTYSVTMCSRCGELLDDQFVKSVRISCCPED